MGDRPEPKQVQQSAVGNVRIGGDLIIGSITQSSHQGATPDAINTTPKISWQEVCRAMLEDRKHLTSNRLLPLEMQHDLIEDDVFVDLALVQQKKADKRSGDVLPEEGSQLYEPAGYAETERFEFKRFLTDVLGDQKNEKLTIIGEPGAGKTTLLQKIAFWLLDNTEDLAIWVSLGELRDKALRDYLAEDWLQEAMMYADPSLRNDWEKQFSQRRVWLLLDGLDEMAAEMRDALSLRGWVTQARVIVTCRLNVWQANPRILHGFETYRMLEFQLPQMEQFIQKWFHPDRAAAQHLQQALNQPGKERIRDLARNPLRLTLLCSTWHLREGKLPDTKAELYKQFVDDLYEWKSDRFPTTSKQRRQLNAKLGELAKEAIDKELTRFRLRHNLVCSVLGESDELGSMLQLALDLGWLNAVGIDATNPRQPVYAFFHPTFQEYFAARAIDDWDFFLPRDHEDQPVEDLENPGKYKPYRIFESQWKEVILLWLGREDVKLREQKEAFIEALDNFQDGCNKFYQYRASFLAAIGIAELRDHPKANQIVDRIAWWSFGDFDDEKQRWWTFLKPIQVGARVSLLETDRRMAIHVLNKLINFLKESKEDFILYEVANILSKIDPENKQVVLTLLNLLNTTQYEWLRLRVTVSLLDIAPDRAEVKTTLLDLLNTSQHERLRRDAAQSLRRINPNCPEAINTLLDLLCNSQDEILRWNLDIEKIGGNHPKVLKTLLNLVCTSQNVKLRIQAGNYLGKIAKTNSQVIQILLGLLQLGKVALNLLGRVPYASPEQGIDFLRNTVFISDVILTSKNKKLCRQAIWHLLKMAAEQPNIGEYLIKIVFSIKTNDTLIKNVQKLSENIGIHDSEIIPTCTELLKIAQSDWVRLHIARVLGKVDPGNLEAIAVLVNLLGRYQNENTKQLVANSLKEVDSKSPQVIEVFLDLLKNSESWDICRWSAQDLGEIANDNSEVVEMMLDLLQNSQERRVSQSTVEGLKKVFNSEALTKIVADLKDYLTKEIRENNSPLYGYCFEVMWHCASRLPYSEFYKVWHGQSTPSES